MAKQNSSIFRKTYHTVSRAEAEYFKKVWLEHTGLSERTFRNRLINPELGDVLLFIHVCSLEIGETMKPFSEKLKNIPAYKRNLQLTIG